MRVVVRWENAEIPDLLQNEAQAIMTGKLDANGVFHANEVLLKCPTRYADEAPAQASK
jgi:cytochrome c-type biogenesis protein CcmE